MPQSIGRGAGAAAAAAASTSAAGPRSSLDSTLSSPAAAVSRGVFPDSLPNSPDSSTVQLPLDHLPSSGSDSRKDSQPSTSSTTTESSTPSDPPNYFSSTAGMPNARRDYEVTRPALGTTNSSTGLLSGDFSLGTAPHDDLSPRGGVSGSSHHDANGNLAPPILPPVAGSQPTTPDMSSAPTFSSPFASDRQLRGSSSPGATLTQRRSSAVPAPSGTSTSGPHEVGLDDADEPESKRDSKRSSGLGFGNFAQRRTLRAKTARNGKKERDSKNMVGATIVHRKPFESTRLKGEIYKPWMEKKDPAQRWARYITLACILIGVGLCAFLCYNGYASVPSLGTICSVLDDDFSSLNTDVWKREVRLDGYGHGEFTWTTDSSDNSYVEDGVLYLVPTLTSDIIGTDAITNGYTLNLTADGTCTSTNVSQCVAVSNSSLLTVINPVRTARLITKNTVNLKYGKVEVKARFPSGDWLWPQISLLPVDDAYGAWPRSGQIDILNARGNNASYSERGVDYAQSDLHWGEFYLYYQRNWADGAGPTEALDRLYLTWGYREQRRKYYNSKYHTYGLEWNEKYMWTYIDSKVSQVISLRFNKQSFWSRGKFPSTVTNSSTGEVTKLTNIWAESNKNVAPFDQEFYLVLTLGVGGIDGWFPDGEGGKPWIDSSGTAMYDFWGAKSKWWDNNWPSDAKTRGFAIDSVKMWKTC